ncbi:hypothetical protein [Pantoea sp.]|uniref:hypothetical protein n=1 Tax=Pantoea sp. TaxID=69393 RepID=UPI0028B0ED77|nr:hypothetical protein [Pantoea sp.]
MKKIFISTSLIIIVGCTSPWPLPIAKPTALDYYNQAGISATKNNGDDTSKEDNLKKTNKSDPPVPKSYNESLFLASAYRQVWHQKEMDLAKQTYALSDIGVLGLITGLIAGVNGAITTAWIGGGVAAGSRLVPEHYQYNVQRKNYRQAAEAANCVVVTLNNVDSGIRTVLDDTNFREIQGMFVANTLREISYLLETKQSQVELIAPDY